ncbi:MAG: TIR domain-containing protein [Pseudomonadota bacterium]
MTHHDVFISYSREDRDKVEKIANALSQQGLHVWWDPKIKTGAGFRQEISDALRATRSVIVIWSRHSVASRFVADEADEGAARDILFPALIDNVDIPLGFRQIQTADLTHWRGNLNDNAFKAFVHAVTEGAALQQGAPDRNPHPAPAPSPTPTPAPYPEGEAPTPEPKPKPEPAPEVKPAPKPRPQPGKSKLSRKASKYTTTGSKRRFALFGQSVFMAALIAAAFGALAYASDFVFSSYRPVFVGAMGVLAFLSRYGTLEADRAAGAASLALLPRSYIALILFSLISIAPLILEGRIYAAALEGVQVKGIEGADINNVTFDQSGARLVTASDDNTIKLWDATTGVERGEFTVHDDACTEEEGRCWIWGADFSPDSTRAISASRDRTAIIWNTANAEPLITLAGHQASIYDAAWHPKGAFVATASSDNTIILWNPESGDAVRTLNGHTDNVNAVDFHPDGELLAAASDDGMVSLWNWREGRRIMLLTAGGAANDVKFSNDGSMFASAAAGGTVRIWRTSDRNLIATLDHGAEVAFAVAFANGDKTLATSGVDPVIRLWNVSTQNLLRELTGHKDGIRGLDSTSDGKFLVSGSRDNTARIWNAVTGKNRVTVGHIDSAIDLPMAIDTPPAFVSSQAPVPVNFSNDPATGAMLLGKGFAIAFILLIALLALKGLFWVVRLRPVARLTAVTGLFVVSAYAGLLIASALPAEALALWLTIAFIPATVFALLRWMWRSLVLRNLNRRTRKT